ncbi:MAG: type-F conjugative transfer system pilin assembly protein TrbC [Legionellaceae bacterium]|nr:type-F conjugative transfer system pilin assembly protein TrbC [Legionellaceae bacterium]
MYFYKKSLINISLLLISSISFGASQVFISFSMPEKLLIETLTECERLNIPATLNGLYKNSMQDTTQKIMGLSKQIPNLSLQIDPFAFERYAISQVPALVVAKDNCFDLLYGNLSLSEGLKIIKQKGACKDDAS